MSENDEGLNVYEGAALVVERLVPQRGTFTLIMPDSMCFEVTEVGKTLRLPKTLRERAAMWRRRYGL